MTQDLNCTFRKRPGRLLNVFYTLKLFSVSMRYLITVSVTSWARNKLPLILKYLYQKLLVFLGSTLPKLNFLAISGFPGIPGLR